MGDAHVEDPAVNPEFHDGGGPFAGDRTHDANKLDPLSIEPARRQLHPGRVLRIRQRRVPANLE
jgi:hypothetical protein